METLTLKEKLTKAFRALRKVGYIARQNFWCCQSCALSALNALPDECVKYVFYHKQDADNLRDNGACYLAWGGDGEQIVSILKEAGIAVEWDGNSATRIKVSDGFK